MADGADEGTSGADDRIGDERCRCCDGRLSRRDHLRLLEVLVPAQCTDPQRTIGVESVVVEFSNVVDVDQHLR